MGWGFCQKCFDNAASDGRFPPCIANQNGLCHYTGEPPIYLSEDEELASNLCDAAVKFSMADGSSLPTVSNLQFVLEHREIKRTLGEHRAYHVVEMIGKIIQAYRLYVANEIRKNNTH